MKTMVVVILLAVTPVVSGMGGMFESSELKELREQVATLPNQDDLGKVNERLDDAIGVLEAVEAAPEEEKGDALIDAVGNVIPPKYAVYWAIGSTIWGWLERRKRNQEGLKSGS